MSSTFENIFHVLFDAAQTAVNFPFEVLSDLFSAAF